ncbi:MAG: mercury(II) reductase [Vicinamibacteraceae bacterium]
MESTRQTPGVTCDDCEPTINSAPSIVRNHRPDIAIVGAGSAGFAAAIRAVELGAHVTLVGHGTIGGTCVNVGCVPSKTLIRAVEGLHVARAASRFSGISAEARVSDWSSLVAQKDDLVSALRKAKYVKLLAAYEGITYVEGRARFANGGLEVGGTSLPAARLLITTGARPAMPPIAGLDAVPFLTSTEALALPRLPGSLVVIGGGYVGCELAQLFARAGVKVTIACRRRLLPEAEPEISGALAEYFGAEGMDVRRGLTYGRVDRTDGGILLSATKRNVPVMLTAEQLLIATGRTPNTEGLGLEDAGIGMSSEGGIAVDAYMRTSRPGVYAAGDVTGRDQFVYMATYGARLAVENALTGDIHRYDHATMPSVVFTDPQVASVGLTEAAARAAGYDVHTAILALDQVPRALAARDVRGLIKLVADRATDRLLGAHLLAPEGADSIQTAAMAIKGGLTTRDLGETIFPYLTTVEGLKLAAQSFTRDVTKLSCCA